MTYINIKAEMARNRITLNTIASFLSLCPSSVSKKINGHTAFKAEEIKAIQQEFFPNVSLDELLQSDALD